MSFKDFYNKEIKEQLSKELKLKNSMAAPRVLKIVLNVGVGEAVSNKNVIEKVQEQLSTIAGQLS